MEFIPTLQTAYCVSILNTSQLILYRVILSVYCKNHTCSKHRTQISFTLRHVGTATIRLKVKVKASPLHAEQAEGEGRGTALPPIGPRANKGWAASATPWSLYLGGVLKD